jgi:hypothetical protein
MSAIFAAAAVLLSYSRHALLCLTLGTLLLLALWHRFNLCVALAVIAAVAFVGPISLNDPAPTTGLDITPAQRIENAFAADVLQGDSRQNVRFYLLKELPGRILASAPLLGFGPGAFSVSSGGLPFLPEDYLFNPNAVSDIPQHLLMYASDVVWVLILGTYGCAGVGVFVYMLGTIAHQALRLRKRASSPELRALAEVCLAWIVILVTAGFFGLTIIARDTIPAFWVAVGAVLASVPPNATRRLRAPTSAPLI